MADGATYQEAVVRTEDVIAEWLETAKGLGGPSPPYAGQTAGSPRATLSTVFHPRIVRGTLISMPGEKDHQPFIPAYAGHTWACKLWANVLSFHPRIRGAHSPSPGRIRGS